MVMYRKECEEKMRYLCREVITAKYIGEGDIRRSCQGGKRSAVRDTQALWRWLKACIVEFGCEFADLNIIDFPSHEHDQTIFSFIEGNFESRPPTE